MAVVLLVVSLAYGVLWTYGQLPDVARWFHALVVGGLVLLAGGLVIVGLVMNAINTGFRETAALQRRVL